MEAISPKSARASRRRGAACIAPDAQNERLRDGSALDVVCDPGEPCPTIFQSCSRGSLRCRTAPDRRWWCCAPAGASCLPASRMAFRTRDPWLMAPANCLRSWSPPPILGRHPARFPRSSGCRSRRVRPGGRGWGARGRVPPAERPDEPLVRPRQARRPLLPQRTDRRPLRRSPSPVRGHPLTQSPGEPRERAEPAMERFMAQGGILDSARLSRENRRQTNAVAQGWHNRIRGLAADLGDGGFCLEGVASLDARHGA